MMIRFEENVSTENAFSSYANGQLTLWAILSELWMGTMILFLWHNSSLARFGRNASLMDRRGAYPENQARRLGIFISGRNFISPQKQGQGLGSKLKKSLFKMKT